MQRSASTDCPGPLRLTPPSLATRAEVGAEVRGLNVFAHPHVLISRGRPHHQLAGPAGAR